MTTGTLVALITSAKPMDVGNSTVSTMLAVFIPITLYASAENSLDVELLERRLPTLFF